MKNIQFLLSFIDRLGNWAGYISALLISGIAVMIIAEVSCRWLLGISLSFSWEYSTYFMGVAFFGGAAYALRTGAHVRVMLFKDFFSRQGQYGLEIFASIIGVCLASYIAWALTAFAWQSFIRGSVSPTIDAIPLVIPQSGIAIGAIVFALAMLARTIRLLIGEPVEDEGAKEKFSVE